MTNEVKLERAMDEYIAQRAKAITDHWEMELKFAFLAGAKAGMEWSRQCTEDAIKEWDTVDANHNSAH